MMKTNVSAQTPADSTATDSTLLKQIELEMESSQPQIVAPRSTISANPDISVIGDFGASYLNNTQRNFDAYLNEAEFSFQSVVDPYIRADFFVSFGKNSDTHEYGAGVEEAFITSLSLPTGLQLKAGKFKSAIGRINPVHSHALPFIDLPIAYENLFGDGLNDEGLSLSWLLPNHAFYQELTAQVTAGYTESPVFIHSTKNDFLYVAHLKNFFSLNDNATLEIGFSGVSGPNDSLRFTQIGAADLTYKWKPLQKNTYKSFTWQSEVYYSMADLKTQKVNALGLYSMISLQVDKRMFLTARYDYAQNPSSSQSAQIAYSATLGWFATEFQKIEIEGKTNTLSDHSQTYQAWLRWIFVIGTHGAHQY
ncbi:hypothetical protein LBMAG27_05340 [Bacteroidota bacterium]|nr:hypothetical protein LBMAG27_05340 [Bacteroidota bacterium]